MSSAHFSILGLMPTKGDKVRVDAHKRAQTAMKVDVNSYTRTFTPRGKNKQPSSEAVKERKRQSLADQSAARTLQRIASG